MFLKTAKNFKVIKNLHNRTKVSQQPRGRIYTLLNASENIMEMTIQKCKHQVIKLTGDNCVVHNKNNFVPQSYTFL